MNVKWGFGNNIALVLESMFALSHTAHLHTEQLKCLIHSMKFMTNVRPLYALQFKAFAEQISDVLVIWDAMTRTLLSSY
jgi:hypothetical protein